MNDTAQVLEEENSGEGSTVGRDLMCRQSRSR